MKAASPVGTCPSGGNGEYREGGNEESGQRCYQEAS